MKRMFAAALAAVVLPASAQAAITINVDQIGSGVVLTGSGSFDTTGLEVYLLNGQSSPVVNPAPGAITVGVSAPITIFTGLSGPVFGYKQSVQRASSATGDAFGFSQYLGGINLPSNYVSNALLNGTSTYDNATFASLGLTAGQYVYRSAADTLTLNIGQSSVPEPATWAMMLAGFGLVGGALRSSRRNLAVRFG